MMQRPKLWNSKRYGRETYIDIHILMVLMISKVSFTYLFSCIGRYELSLHIHAKYAKEWEHKIAKLSGNQHDVSSICFTQELQCIFFCKYILEK